MYTAAVRAAKPVQFNWELHVPWWITANQIGRHFEKGAFSPAMLVRLKERKSVYTKQENDLNTLNDKWFLSPGSQFGFRYWGIV